MAISVTKATAADAQELADNMREADVEEIKAIGGHAPLMAVLISIANSHGNAWAARYKGRLVAIYGLVEVSVLNGIMQPWVLTTTSVDQIPKEYVKASKAILAAFRSRASLLLTTIDARYVKALRWAKALGFDVHPAQKIGLDGQDFHLVSMKGLI